MPVYEVIPHERVGPVHLGMKRSEVRAVLGGSVEPFEKVPGKEVDAFDNAGLHVYYVGAEDPTVEFIEAFSVPGVSLNLYGFDPLALPADEVLERLGREQSVIEAEPGCLFDLLGRDVSLWRSSPLVERFEAVGVGEYGYMPDRAI